MPWVTDHITKKQYVQRLDKALRAEDAKALAILANECWQVKQSFHEEIQALRFRDRAAGYRTARGPSEVAIRKLTKKRHCWRNRQRRCELSKSGIIRQRRLSASQHPDNASCPVERGDTLPSVAFLRAFELSARDVLEEDVYVEIEMKALWPKE